MLEKIKNALLSIFGGGSESKAKNKSGKKHSGKSGKSGKSEKSGKNKDKSGKKHAVNEEKTGKKSGKNKDKSGKKSKAEAGGKPGKTGKPESRHSAAADAAETVPPRPEKLEEVPEAEGKKRFLDFPLDEKVQYGIQLAKFKYCTPIQALTLAPLLEGRDLAGKAQTGTGKTAAFLVAVFTRLLSVPEPENRKNGECRALVLAPTRELAMQIYKDAGVLGAYTGLKMALVFGGMDYRKQMRELEQPIDLLVGTPGRVIDYLRQGCLNFRRSEFLVVDEADRMLDMGFIPDVKRIVNTLPPKGKRQTLLFSATLDESILHLCSGWLADPAVIESEPEHLVGDTIEQHFYTVSREEKLGLTLHLLQKYAGHRVLIFGNRKDVNIRLQRDLAKYGWNVPLLSGDVSQEKRIAILERFRSGEYMALIATDVAARGIHVDDVSLVINYDLPEQPEDYVHRIGRTGRAGKSGKSVSFLCEYGAYNLPGIEKLLNTEFHSVLPEEEWLKLPEPVKNPVYPGSSRGTGERKGGRPHSSSRPRSGNSGRSARGSLGGRHQ